VVTTGAWAGNVPVGNPSFESPNCGAAGSGVICAPNVWVVSNSADQWAPTTGQFNAGQFPANVADTSLPDGIQAGWVNGGATNSLSQILGTDIAANTTYTLQVFVGLRTKVTNTFGAIVGIDDGSDSVILNEATVALPEGNIAPTAGNWEDWTVTFDSANDPAAVGDPLEIYLGSTTNQTGYDDVLLTSTADGGVPEPAMFALVGAGLLGLVTRRRFAK